MALSVNIITLFPPGQACSVTVHIYWRMLETYSLIILLVKEINSILLYIDWKTDLDE